MELGDALRRNQVAMISLLVACSSFGYAAWRNESSEYNRTIREAGFETIREIAGLERVLFFAHYDKDERLGNPRQGWSHVLTLIDLADLQGESVRTNAAALRVVWQKNWSKLGRDDKAADRISTAIDELRMATRRSLAELE